MSNYNNSPIVIDEFNIDLPEMMYYLYLPIMIPESDWVIPILPANLDVLRLMIKAARENVKILGLTYSHVYVSARKGWASPDNPLNRPGWHCDGFGTDDMNYVWWTGPGTRFASSELQDISPDHVKSLEQFEQQVKVWYTLEERCLYRIDPCTVHATPLIKPPGCMRQFVKISFSNHRYNLENNSVNYEFRYKWKMYSREEIRNDPNYAGQDFVKEA